VSIKRLIEDDVLYLSPLSGELKMLRHPGLGCMVTPQNDRGVPDGMVWAADNGCFSQGERFDLGRWLAWLGTPRLLAGRCLFAVTGPDVVGDAEATWRQTSHVLPLVRRLGYPAAYVAQDGFTAAAVDWSAFDVLFIGGTTAWKRAEAGGYAAIAEGKRRGLWVHVGRVNGGPFLRNVAAAGADSADGTGLAINPSQNWPRIRRALDLIARQPPLSLEAGS
jgi:hypothetical protein